MIYTDAFYEDIIRKISSTQLKPDAIKLKISYVRTMQALDKEGAQKHAAYVKKTRYDINKVLLYHPTEIYAQEGITQEEYKKIRMQSSPMHIEYWAPKKTENRDDPMMGYFTLEQYFEKEVKDFGEAWELAKENEMEFNFIGSEMSGGCFEVCSRAIKEWKSKIEDIKPGVFDDSLNEQKALFALIEHYQRAYVTELGGMNGDIETLPANLATYEPFVAWLMKQKFTVNGKQPKDVRSAVERELIETFSWSSVKDISQRPLQKNSDTMEVENIGASQNTQPQNTQPQNAVQTPLQSMSTQEAPVEPQPSITHVAPVQNEKALANKKLNEILPNYSIDKRTKLQQLYDVNIRLKKKEPFEALSMAVDAVEKLIVEEQEAAREAPVMMEQEVFWANKGSKVLDSTSDPTLMKLPVLDQVKDKTNFGKQSCGYHATKNALAMVYCLSKKDQPGIWVNDLGYFNNIFNKLKTYASSSADDSRDINVVQVKAFIQDVHAKKFQDPVIDKVSGALVANNKPKLPAISVAGFAMEENKFGYASSGSSNLEDAANLYYIATHGKKELQHTFILGNSNDEGHWITLTLNQDSSGERNWIGTNSDANHEADLINVKKGLEELMKYPQAYANDTYAIAVGDNLAQRANYISKNNLSVSSQNKEVLLKSEKENIADIQNAMQFMKRCGWLNGDSRKEHEKEIGDIQYLVLFYAEQNTPSKKEWTALKEKIEPLSKHVEQSIQNREHEVAKHKEEEAKAKELAAKKEKEEAQIKLELAKRTEAEARLAVEAAKSEHKQAKQSDDPDLVIKSKSQVIDAQEAKKVAKEAETKAKREADEAKRKESQAKREEKEQREKLQKLEKEEKDRQLKEQMQVEKNRLETAKSLKTLVKDHAKEEIKEKRAAPVKAASKVEHVEVVNLQVNKKKGEPSKWQQQRELKAQRERQVKEEKERAAQAEKELKAQAANERKAQIEKDRQAKAEKQRMAQAENDRQMQAEKERKIQAEKERKAQADAKSAARPARQEQQNPPQNQTRPQSIRVSTRVENNQTKPKPTQPVVVIDKNVNPPMNNDARNENVKRLNISVFASGLKMINVQNLYDQSGAKKSIVSKYLKFQHGDRPKQIKSLQDAFNRASSAFASMDEVWSTFKSDESKIKRIDVIFKDLETAMQKVTNEMQDSGHKFKGTSRMENVLTHYQELIVQMRKASHVPQAEPIKPSRTNK